MAEHSKTFFLAAALIVLPLFFTAGADEPPSAAASLSISEAMDALDASLSWEPLFQSGIITSRERMAAFNAVSVNAGTKKDADRKNADGKDAGTSGTGMEKGTGAVSDTSVPVLVDNQTVIYLPAPYMENGSLRFPKAFVDGLAAGFEARSRQEEARFSIAAIVVDPGHGGKDAGASGSLTVKGKKVKAVEKDITLGVSKELFALLRKRFPDKRLLITRSGDTYPTLEDRVNKAHSVPLKDNEAVIFISIHANASFNRHARGYEVWYLSPEYRREIIDPAKTGGNKEVALIFNDLLEEEFTTESVLLADSIMKRFGAAFGKELPSRGVKAEEWFVVRKARMPSVLVELGFVTNEQDAGLMIEEKGQKRFADALFEGVVDFVERFEASGGFTEVAARPMSN